MTGRPLLCADLDSTTFKQYYYLRKELVAFCRASGLSSCGNKEELTERIWCFLDTGEKLQPVVQHRARHRQREITLESRIEENLVCSERHRHFFRQIVGPSFTFRVAFQKWLKSHAGSTYAEAVNVWFEMCGQQKTAEIDRQFEYNTYIRDFFLDNPGKSFREAICCWNYKKSLPGTHRYERSDLSVLSEK